MEMSGESEVPAAKSAFPPPPPPRVGPPPVGYLPMARPARFKVNKWVIGGGVVLVLAVIGGAVGKKDSGKDDNSDIDGQVARWNSLTASGQADLCESVHISGGTAVALRLQWPGTIDDVAWFLETQACD